MEKRTPKWEWAALLAVLLAAAFLRLYQLDSVPPGWRDDELINSLVISQHVLDGEWALFYPDASGHEALYHVLNAGMLALFGPGAPGLRWLSVLLGLLSVWLTYLLGRELFGRVAGLIAAAGLASSFWSLMYSRLGLRHVSLLPLMLAAFYLWFRAIKRPAAGSPPLGGAYATFAFSGLCLGLGFYTYFASRGVPFILLAVAGYWLLFDRPRFRLQWRGMALALLLAAVLYAPLWSALRNLPEMTGRVEELAVPLVEARQGNLEPLWDHVRSTLSMFYTDGDGEWLYNIPHRPVFNWWGALLFSLGLLILAYRAWPFTPAQGKVESVFLLLWLAAGLAPGFISVPPASMGHTIIAQPAAYLVPAVALVAIGKWAVQRWARWGWLAIGVLALLFLGSNAARDLHDYFTVWPERGMVRFLYRAEIHDAAVYLNSHPEVAELAFAGGLAGPWDRLALEADLSRELTVRWFDPSRALVFPAGGGHVILTGVPELAKELEPFFEAVTELLADGTGFDLYWVDQPELEGNLLPAGEPVSFTNGLTLLGVQVAPSGLILAWRADEPPFELPPFQLISNPPPPGADSRPRLQVFAHLLDQNGRQLAVDDAFGADPYSLRPGDLLWQVHRFVDMGNGASVAIGLYDPVSGARAPLANGDGHLLVGLELP